MKKRPLSTHTVSNDRTNTYILMATEFQLKTNGTNQVVIYYKNKWEKSFLIITV